MATYQILTTYKNTDLHYRIIQTTRSMLQYLSVNIKICFLKNRSLRNRLVRNFQYHLPSKHFKLNSTSRDLIKM